MGDDARENYGHSVWPPYVPRNGSLRGFARYLRVAYNRYHATRPIKTLPLADVLRNVSEVDLIDFDIQDAEGAVIQSSQRVLMEKVKRISVETHSTKGEAMVRNTMQSLGWVSRWDFPQDAVSDTPYGKIFFQGGRQTWIHPKFAHCRLSD
jgi:hypothetical protein